MVPKHVPRVRKQKAKARLGASSQKSDDATDSNAAEILPDDNRRKMREELLAHKPAQSMSSKKKKRLEHYIDTKLRKEQNQELIKKLASQSVDTSLLRSSKNLGRQKDTKREALSRALQETAQGINEDLNAKLLFEDRAEKPIDDPADSEEDDEESGEEVSVPPTRATDTAQAPSRAFGSGLKRPLHVGDDGLPQIKKRKRRKVAKPQVVEDDDESASDLESNASSASDVWNGFSEDENQAEVASEASSEPDDPATDSDSDSSSASSAPDSNRAFSFKEWAEQQRNQAVGFVPSHKDATLAPKSTLPHVQKPFDAISAPALGPMQSPEKKIASIVVPRTEDIQTARLQLPVVQEEQRIMEAINNNKITVVCGATGSGKTTQVPQMMFESGFGSSIGQPASGSTDKKAKGMIGVTQPRRVAATSVADRVADEMGEMRNRVGHQVRFDSALGPKTAIKFMTDGILLREVASDFTLSKYSAIVIDEAHERSVNTDILIGLLSRIVDLREGLSREKPDEHYPLKLVIMSATMRVQDFTANNILFRTGAPPMVEAEGRQFSVVNHFARQTRRDYLDEMFRKVSKGHRKLPKGGILVFLTGQAEILTLSKRLREEPAVRPSEHGIELLEVEDWEDDRANIPKTSKGADDEVHQEDDDYIAGLSDEEDKEFDIVDEETESDAKALEMQSVHVVPLYSQLPAKEQAKVFQPPPEGSRLIVLATNVAETSITIPGIKYVFDCGRAKEKQYDTRTGVQTFDVSWISKASAAQRAGRAGRTGPGHCYRLYSSAVYERDFDEYTVPEILRSPVENVALMIKGVDFPNVANFPFPTPPDRHALSRAEDLLRHLGAVDGAGKITQTGRSLLNYPLNPRYGRMLLLASGHGLLAHTMALVSALAIPELLMTENQVSPKLATGQNNINSDDSDDDSRARCREREAVSETSEKLRAYKKAQSILSRWDPRCDAFKLLVAFGGCHKAIDLHSSSAQFFIREKGMSEALALRSQLVRIVQMQHPTLTPANLTDLPIPNDGQRAKLKYILAAGFSDQVAIREDLLPDVRSSNYRAPRRVTDVPYRTLLPSADGEVKSVYIHASSVLAQLGVSDAPQFVVYSHLSRVAARTVGGEDQARTRMHALTTVGAKQLVALMDGTELFEVGKPIGKITVLPREGGREKRECWVGVGLKGAEGVRWDLGVRKERQVRKAGEWRTEEVLG
ncbi:P-loop containing nucleoside triphosphate hydrolase protein [Myriangium duriaei CBS 260.36]|uniref:RNA helicase n=1 Tax=Myriangium duriaei CBS 260.36 TaxID=1168546 RepID=A0A9P4JC42_9PEZI|nr:P-loop containing nucleoside triphosphate hydrolase protein [Myriangium duriaei CBS 260.36]